ncbi:hypothetical protein [uncultured Alistipes sp.]|uniref:hypothetical protein n=1 Tax=uncultured Alistipes sp. TaxID=538949 RepID=UPI0025E8EFA1|nr:hypothetical protein [uncultured Alistipes sp.]
MKRFVIFLIAAAVAGALLPGCCPCRHLAASSRDSVRVEVRERIVHLRDTVTVEVPVESVRQTVRDTMSHLETSYAFSEARINPDGSLTHSLENKDGEHPVEVDAKIVYRDSIVYRDRTNWEIVEVERELTPWQKFRLRAFWVLLAVLLFIGRRPITRWVGRVLKL